MSASPPLPEPLAQAVAAGLIDAALQAILTHFGCQAGTVHLWQDGILKLRASIGIPPQVTALVQTVPLGKGIAGLAAERRAPITICNLQTDNSGQARAGARATGLEGSLAVPMLSAAGELRGVLGIAKATAHEWTETETALVQAVAARLAEVEL